VQQYHVTPNGSIGQGVSDNEWIPMQQLFNANSQMLGRS
jgi:hypothetical protein